MSEDNVAVSHLLGDITKKETEKDKTYVLIFVNILFNRSIIFYIAVSILGAVFLISMVVGAWNIRVKAANRKPSCIVNSNPWRLPNSIKPRFYRLDLSPNLTSMKFDGTVDIMMQVAETTNCIVLSMEELKIASVLLRDRTGRKIPIFTSSYNNKTMQLHYSFDEYLEQGNTYYMKFEFSGDIRNDLRGFYKSYYKNNNNETKWMATTQFESSDARTAFPCFDEPIFKAQIQLSVTLRKEEMVSSYFTVISNMPEQNRTTLTNGNVNVLFKPTPAMSTYLLAFCIGEYDWVEEKEDDITYRVISVPGQREKGRFALEAAIKVTEFFNEFFNINLIAIPDFRAGAMENWGLITFRERYLLIDNTATLAEKQAVAEVVAHEIAHQWSGNLVTMKWWSDLYLNEGFATFFEAFVTDRLNPTWKTWEQYLYATVQPLLVTDAQKSTHALVNPVDQVHQIEAIFDNISYNKGSSVLRMLYNYLGVDKFRDWMRKYFSTFKYNNTLTADLTGLLKDVTGDVQLSANVDTWMRQAGFPVVTVNKVASNQYTFSQKRFFSDISNANATEQWWIPLDYIDSTGKKAASTFSLATSNPVTISSEWIKLNYGQIGLYRVNYPREMWASLATAIKAKSQHLQVADRYGLLDDIFALSKTGSVNISSAFEFANALREDETYVIWNALLSNLNSIASITALEPVAPYFERFVQDLLEEIVAEVGWNEQSSDSDDRKRLRPLVLNAACAYGTRSCIQTAKAKFADMRDQNKTIATELRATVYYTIVREGGESEYQWMLNRFLTSDIDPSEQYRCMYALATTKNPALLKQTLLLTLSPHVRSQDGVYLIRSVSRNVFGTDLAWDWIRQNYEALLSKFGRRTVELRLIAGATGLFANSYKYKEVEQFFGSRTDSKSALASALETIRINEQFLNLNLKDMTQWLKQNYPLK